MHSLWKRFKTAWKILFQAQLTMNDLQVSLDLLPSKPMAKATNRGNNWYIEFAVEMPRPKHKKKNPWQIA